MRKIVVLISGGGSNLQALIDAIANGVISAEISAVISNKSRAYGLTRAANAGIPTRVHMRSGYANRVDYDVALADLVAGYQPDLIVLAGWMHILNEVFIDRFPQKIINLHPALPNQFAGTHAIERAFAAFQAGETVHSGCMVHFVIPEVDAGEPLVTARVGFRPNDTLETFAARMHRTEHKLIVLATQLALEA
jgi:formyltetrahydrofolate-dependent phosphoribosylglycinamide formyltransferase